MNIADNKYLYSSPVDQPGIDPSAKDSWDISLTRADRPPTQVNSPPQPESLEPQAIDLNPYYAPEDPALVLSREQETRQVQIYQEQDAKVRQMKLDRTRYFTGERFPFSETREQAEILAGNDAFIANETGIPVDQLPMSGPGRDYIIQQLADIKFNGKGAESEEAFDHEITSMYQKRKDFEDITQKDEDGKKSLDTLISESVMNDKGPNQALAEWQAEYATDPRYDPANFSRVKELTMAQYQSMKEKLDEAKAYASPILESLRNEKADATVSYAQEDTVAMLAKVPEKIRPMVIAVLAKEAKKEGDQQLPGWHATQQFARGMISLLEGPSNAGGISYVVDIEKEINKLKPGDSYPMWDKNLYESAAIKLIGGTNAMTKSLSYPMNLVGPSVEFKPENRVLTQADIDTAKNRISDEMEKISLKHQLVAIAQGSLDPLKGDNWVSQKMWYPFLNGSASYAFVHAVASRSGVGAIIVPMMQQQMAYDNTMQIMDENPGIGMAKAWQIGNKASYFQSAIEYAEVLLTMGASKMVPGLLRETSLKSAEKLVGKEIVNFVAKDLVKEGVAKEISGALKEASKPLWSQALKYGAINFVGQNVQEGFQDIATYIVQKWTNDAPEINWHEVMYGRNGDPGFWRQRIDVALALAPAMGFGTALATHGYKMERSHLEALANSIKDHTLLKAAGLPEDIRTQIINEKSPSAALNMLVNSMPSAKAEIAAEGQAEMAKCEAKWMRKVEQSQTMNAKSDVMPRITQTSEGYGIFDRKTGKSFGKANTMAEAEEVISTHSNALDEDRANKIDYLVGMADAGRAGAELDPSATTENHFDLASKMGETQVAESTPEDLNNFYDESANRAEIEGNGAVVKAALGSHRTEFRNKVRHYVNRFYQGASMKDVIHEIWHGITQKADDLGLVSREEKINLVREFDRQLQGMILKRGELAGKNLGLLPAGIADADISDKILGDAISRIGEIALMRLRKEGDSGLNIQRSVVSNHYTALARMAAKSEKFEGLSKFRAMIESARGLIGVVSAQANVINRAIREGRFDEAKVNALLDKMNGRNLDAEQSADVARREKEIISQKVATGDTVSGTEYSLTTSDIVDKMGSHDPTGLLKRQNESIPIIEINNADLIENASNRRDAVIEFLMQELGGRVIINHDSNLGIYFNTGRQGQRQATKNTRNPNVARALFSAEDIVKNAIHANIEESFSSSERSESKKEKSRRTEQYHWFIIPVKMDDHSYVAWFNARKNSSFKSLVFDSFGLVQTKAPVADESVNSSTKGIDSLTGATGTTTIGEILKSVKGELTKHLPHSDTSSKSDSSPDSSLGEAEAVDKLPQLTAEQEKQVEDLAFANAKKSREVNTDHVRPVIPGYDQADPHTREALFHPIASAINSKVLKRMLAEPPEKGRVLVLAGGGGSGKSTVLGDLKSKFDFTFDTTLSYPGSAQRQLEKIEQSGRKMTVVYVHRVFPKAFDTILQRYYDSREKTGAGRIVPLKAAIEAHLGAQNEVLGLKGAEIIVFDNNKGLGEHEKISLEQLRKQRYYEPDEPTGTPSTSGAGGRGRDIGNHPPDNAEENTRAAGAGETSSRAEAAARLEEEGRRILSQWQADGLLNNKEVSAFLAGLEDKPQEKAESKASESTSTDTPASESGSTKPKPLDTGDLHTYDRLHALHQEHGQGDLIQEGYAKAQKALGRYATEKALRNWKKLANALCVNGESVDPKEMFRHDELLSIFKLDTEAGQKVFRDFLEGLDDFSNEKLRQEGTPLPPSFRELYPKMYHYTNAHVLTNQNYAHPNADGTWTLSKHPYGGRYVGFEDLNSQNDAQDKFQLPLQKQNENWEKEPEKARYKFITDTAEDLRIPPGWIHSQDHQGARPWLEIFVKDNPRCGNGGALQSVSNVEITGKVVDLDTGKIVTNLSQIKTDH
jgi:Zeta toxin